MILRTVTMVANNRVRKVRVETHARGHAKRHVGKKSHAKGRQSGNGSCRSNEVSIDFLDAEHVFGVGVAEVFLEICLGADTRPAAIRGDGC
jgi:hypothetical protein